MSTQAPEKTADSANSANPINLGLYDFELILDKSSSMTEADCKSGKTRWDWAKEWTEGAARAMQKYDDDGLTVSFFSGNHKTYESTTPDKVHQIFTENSPSGSTNLAGVLEARLDAYRSRKAKGNAKPLVLVVITDGEPDDQQAVINSLANHTKHISNRRETGILFAQVGHNLAARNYLSTLDNSLPNAAIDKETGKPMDIVSSKNFDELENLSYDDAFMAALSE